MPFTETGAEKVKRKAYENKNKREKGIEFEKKRDYELFGTTEQNIPAVDAMGSVTGMKNGGKTASSRADGCAIRGKTRA
jgi:hypothetical protein